MRVAIIDDEKESFDLLKSYLIRYQKEHGGAFEIETFSSGEELLKDYRAIYDILIFDIQMPGISGIDAAKKVREHDKKAIILFITSMAQYALQGYEVEAVDYIIKPLSYYDFAMKIAKVIRKVVQQEEVCVAVDTQEGIRKVLVSGICYMEVLGHYIYYHTKEGLIVARGSMKEAEEQFTLYNFVRVHKSYIVNLRHVTKVDANDVEVNGERIPLGRVYRHMFLQAFLRFVNAK